MCIRKIYEIKYKNNASKIKIIILDKLIIMKIRKRFGTDIIVITILLSTFSSFYIWTPVLKRLQIQHGNKEKSDIELSNDEVWEDQ